MVIILLQTTIGLLSGLKEIINALFMSKKTFTEGFSIDFPLDLIELNLIS